MNRRVVLDERIPRDAHRLLGEDARKLFRVIGETDLTPAQLRDVLQQLRVDVVIGPQSNHADRDAGVRVLLQQCCVVPRFFAVLSVREQDDVPRRKLTRLHQFVAGSDQSLIHIDAATHALNAEHVCDDRIRIINVSQRLNDVRRTIDREHRHLVLRRQHLDALRRAEIGEVHLLFATLHRHRHASRPIECHRDRDPVLAMLFTQLHRDRQDVIERTLEITSDTETPLAPRDQQSAAEVFNPLSQAFHLQPPEVGGRDVLDDRRSVLIE